MKQSNLKNLAFSAVFGLLMSFSNAATVNLSLTVAPEDGFTLRNSLGNFLPETGIVKIGFFYDSTTGNALDGSAITALYSTAASFSAGNTALLSKFLEIGSAQMGWNSINGLEAGFLAGDQDRPYGTASLNFARVDDNGGPIQGSFFRGWLDGTLPIQSANVGTAPFNSITNVKLTGALLSVIAYNNESMSAASELLVARSLSSLPTSDEATSFALGVTTSELLIGTAAASAYQTVGIPEPSSTMLLMAGVSLFIAYRRKTSVNL
jgi:PEP-CTERM motif